jgi:ABC-type phosphate transport system substrate-binding protein
MGAELLGPVPRVSFEIVVHPDHLGHKITPLQLRRIFLRRIAHWPDGRRVVPVNGPPGSALREQIHRWLFPEGHARVVDHWNKLYYQGILPPRALASYSAVALMVARVPGAIGYVPAGLVSPQVRILTVTGVGDAASRAGDVTER